MDDDPLLVVLVEADVGEELAGAGVAEGTIRKRFNRFRAGAGLDLAGVNGDGA